MSIDRSRRITFEEVADLYAEVRPSYPESLFEDLISLSAIPSGGTILEIGPGPGNATVPLAQRGYHILAVELGERLAALAAERCRSYPKVRIVQMPFEDWKLQENAFDLVIAADAFHWIEPQVGYPKAAKALKASGSAAFFWNVPVDPGTGWSRDIDQLYQKLDPQLENPDKGFTVDWLMTIIEENFAGSGCFGPVSVKQYTWTECLTTDHLVKRLRTFSSHRGIDEGIRQRLYAGVKEVIDGVGGHVERPAMAVLFHAGKKS